MERSGSPGENTLAIDDPPPSGGDSRVAVGGTFGKYQIRGIIGEGGMGTVYDCFDPILQRPCAIKILKRELAEREEFARRFFTEARAVASLNHPNIVQIHDISPDPPCPFYVMEKFGVRNLSAIVKDRGKWSVERLLPIFRQIVSGLKAARRNHILHRDIKPENILINDEEQVKIIDFGLSKFSASGERQQMTVTGVVMGSPFYMSPEQGRGTREVDFRTDVYSAGATFFHLLAGAPPFPGDSVVDVILKHCSDPRPRVMERRPDCPVWLSDLITGMMAIEPEKRPDYEEIESLFLRHGVGGGTLSASTAHLPVSPVSPSRFALGKKGIALILFGLVFLAYINAKIAVTEKKVRDGFGDKRLHSPEIKIFPDGRTLFHWPFQSDGERADFSAGFPPFAPAESLIFKAQQATVPPGCAVRLNMGLPTDSHEWGLEYSNRKGLNFAVVFIPREGPGILVFQVNDLGREVHFIANGGEKRVPLLPLTPGGNEILGRLSATFTPRSLEIRGGGKAISLSLPEMGGLSRLGHLWICNRGAPLVIENLFVGRRYQKGKRLVADESEFDWLMGGVPPLQFTGVMEPTGEGAFDQSRRHPWEGKRFAAIADIGAFRELVKKNYLPRIKAVAEGIATTFHAKVGRGGSLLDNIQLDPLHQKIEARAGQLPPSEFASYYSLYFHVIEDLFNSLVVLEKAVATADLHQWRDLLDKPKALREEGFARPHKGKKQDGPLALVQQVRSKWRNLHSFAGGGD